MSSSSILSRVIIERLGSCSTKNDDDMPAAVIPKDH